MRSLLSFALLLALAAPAGADDPRPFVGLTPLDVADKAHRDPVRLERLGGLGRILAATRPVAWDMLEPAAPAAGGPRYVWKTLDDAVLLWQLTDFDPVLVLSPSSRWASRDARTAAWPTWVRKNLQPAEAKAALRTATGARPLRVSRADHWERFVRDVVERYDGDGTADMPGLRRPLRHVQILDGVDPAHWLGTPDELLRLLHHASLGLRAASSKARMLAPTVDLRATGYAPHPDRREWDWRIGQVLPKSAPLIARQILTRHIETARRLIDMPRVYDVFCHAGSAHLADDVSNVGFLRRTLNEGGGQGKGIWLMDNPTRKLGAPQTVGVVAPDLEEQRLRRRWLPVARNPRHSQYGRARAWMRRGQAFDLVRGLCRARAAGADAVLCQAPWDELPQGHALRDVGAGQGLLTVPADNAPAVGGQRTASWHALAQANRLLAGHRSAGETRIGAPGQSVIFQFDRKQDRPWVAVVMLDPRLSWAGAPGEPMPLRDVLITLPSGAYTLEWCQTSAAVPRRREVVVTDGSFTVSLGPDPVYVIPKR